MEVVINGCPGGFNLSVYGEKKLAEAKHLELHYYQQTKFFDLDKKTEFAKMDRDPVDGEVYYTLTKNIGHTVFGDFPDIKGLFFFANDITRIDLDLIQLLKDHGSKLMSGKGCELKIVNIPDDIDWVISEYDGLEHVAERHRTWN